MGQLLRYIALGAIALNATVAHAEEVSTGEVILPASQEPAGQNNPACVAGYQPTTAQATLPIVYKALDSYLGFPVASSMSTAIPGLNGWLAARFGVHNGPSTCASQCIVVPVSAVVRACMRDQDGRQCKTLSDGDGPLAWAGTERMTTENAKGKKVVCTTGKNWSHDRDRAFNLEAEM